MGRATAQRFAEAGAQLVLADLSGEQDAAAEEIGENAVAISADVSDERQVEAIFALANERFGGVDVLCNVAGIGSAGNPLAAYPTEEFEKELNVNLRGVFLGMKHGIASMVSGGRVGSVINWSSGAGLKAVPLASGYVASKAGVVQLTQSAALEYGPQGIRVNAICPGVIRTPLSERVMAAVPEVAEQWKAATPLGRLGEPGEVAEVALFLASDASSYVSGVALTVDGGMNSTR
jgi:NAD(P)-dependent dehydrogenase (short-subunit alcohol dehydrogenase family)